MNEGKSDIWIGFGLLALCAFAAWRSLLVRTVETGTIAGATFMPWLMIGGLAILALVMIARALRRGGLTGGAQIDMPDRGTLVRMGLLTVLLIAYAAAFMTLGYLASTVIVFVLGLLLFRERRPLVLILVPIVLTGAIYLGFTRLLQVWLP
ncbi:MULTISPECIES: tripartite tricarboxylate transporter TctB family protein [unclassified Thioclava]|uniref:tripartite tricarboxylate transporter TctB family protein n=1 Tax=unclassified Thioclava TaxID=2621713 RepID=UPI000B53FF6C|nr:MULTISPECIES: tripartite tricarboxylate transporter TctB family protein [unclassified Thioclava]